MRTGRTARETKDKPFSKSVYERTPILDVAANGKYDTCYQMEGSMTRKMIAVLTSACFLISSLACIVTKTEVVPPRAVTAQKGAVDVLAVLKTDGQKIQFDKSRPGVVREGMRMIPSRMKKRGESSERIEKVWS